MADALADLPRLPDEALGPCACCGQVMLRTAVPIFYRVRVQYCGVDLTAINERAGLAQVIAGGRREHLAAGMALAGVMGPGQPPVIIMDSGEVNVCMACALKQPDVLGVLGQAL